MKKLILGLAMAFAATAEAECIEYEPDDDWGMIYNLDTNEKTAEIGKYEGSSKELNVATVEYSNETYTVTGIANAAFQRCALTSVRFPNVTSVGVDAFSGCGSLTSAWFPNVISVGEGAFQLCTSLTFVSLPSVETIGQNAFYECRGKFTLVVHDLMEPQIAMNQRSYYGINQGVNITYFRGPSYSVVKAAGYEVKDAVVKIIPSSVIVKSGDAVLDEDIYDASCVTYGITPPPRPYPHTPSAEDYVAVQKTELQAAKAETVKVENGIVTLGVNVCSNANFSAETKDWRPVELKPGNVKVENGKVVITLPVDSPSGFMILQSGDAKIVPSDGNGTPKLPEAEIEECD